MQFKAQLTQDKWDVALKGVRTLLGNVLSRTELGSKKHSSLSALPSGEYFNLISNKSSKSKVIY